MGHGREALFLGEERMSLVGVDRVHLLDGMALLVFGGVGDGQVDQVIVVVDPDVLDGLQFHLLGRGVVGPDLLTNFKAADGLLAFGGYI